MEKSEIKYSLKNIPIPSKESYQLILIDKIESSVKPYEMESILLFKLIEMR